MALYIDEEEVWKCPRHPSKKRRTGICHVCLRERLSSLCPDCANIRPCACYAAATTSSSSSCSSSSHFSSAAAATESFVTGIGTVGLVSNLIESEPSFRRSRSLAIPFLRSKPPVDHDCSIRKDSRKTASPFWSLFKSSRSSGNVSNRGDVERYNAVLLEQEDANKKKKKNEEERRKMMRKSRSVAVSVTSDSRGGDVKSSKGMGWYFRSPIKAFKQSASRGIIVQERSPLRRG
ncbi:hypothetical protein P3X46_025936 [Hevea brasiliensis]|uniref:Uncharacterized protein n=1 Tax=Hevea brasiliensis TaxID=3981 RepID=A0ABQ9KXX8_HEVBR|nr:uncharacterized protein LOC110669378 [Hevea brasiliensis]KAJ9152362.1 hypothetical protein P3X46_025936 [Hevea brasiliensis]